MELCRDRLGGSLRVVKRASGPDSAIALGRELGLLADGHPAFPRALDVDGEAIAPQAIALEHVAGEPLAAVSRRSPDAVRGCLADHLAALEHLHEKQIVHGDLKPEHLLVDADGHGRLLDLGLATPFGSFSRGGTPRYLPPEVLEGAPAASSADLYSFGVAAFEAVGGSDSKIDALLRACASPRAAERPASALACISALGETRRRLSVLGAFPRLGDDHALAASERALIGGSGLVVLIAAARGAGRRRFVRDVRARCLLRGRGLLELALDTDPGWLARAAEVFAVRLSGDRDRDAAAVAVHAARAGLPLVATVDDARSAATARAIAVAVRRVGAAGFVAIGALSEADARASDTSLAALPEPAAADVAALFELAYARIDAPLIADVLSQAGPRFGVVASLARRAAREPLRSVERIRQAVAELEKPTSSAVEPSFRAPARDAAGRRAAALAQARASSFGEALAELAALGEAATDEDRLLELSCLERLGHLRRADARASELAEDRPPGLRAAALAVAAHVALALGDPARAQTLASDGLRAASAAAADRNPPGALGLARSFDDVVGRLHTARSDAALRAGHVEQALGFASEATAHAEAVGDAGLISQALSRRAAARALGGDPGAAKGDYSEALARAEQAGDVGGLPAFIMNLATAEHALGQLGAAIEHYQEAASLAERLGRRANRLAALTNLAGLWIFVGARVEAERLLDDGDALAAETGEAVFAAQLLLLRAELASETDRVLALDLARRAREAFAAAGADRQALESELLLAELGVRVGAFDRALAFVGQRREALDRAGLGPRTALLAARASAGASAFEAAGRWAELAASSARSAGDHELEARALFEQATAAEATLAGSASGLFAQAKATLMRAAEGLGPSMRQRFLACAERRVMLEPRATSAPAAPAGLGRDAQRLLALVRRVLCEGQESKVLEAAIDEAVALTGAERAMLVLARERGAPEVAIARNVDSHALREKRFRFSRSVAERVIKTGEAVITASAPDDPDLGRTQSILDLGLRSILCVPIRTMEKTIGALYLDHRIERGRFAEAERELTVALADILGIALEKARLLDQAERRARDLEHDNQVISLENERRALEVERLAKALSSARIETSRQGGIVGHSHKLQVALDVARRVAPSDLPVLVRGESGTGKELFARFVHSESARAQGPFVAINCGAVPETLLETELFGHKRGAFTGATSDHAGLFRQADGGTLFLDEIGEMPLRMQTRLLRVLQEKEVRPVGGTSNVKVDVRIVAATHKNLEEATAAGTFREDLYYRLLGARVVLPALRERKEDTLELAQAILARLSERYKKPYSLSAAAESALLRHDWPGNVRELEQTLTRGALLSPTPEIDAATLDLQRPTATRTSELRGFDRTLMEQALAAAKGNRSLAAKALGISRVTLHRWIKRYGVA